jgi:predicted RND superfamily exporter protein
MTTIKLIPQAMEFDVAIDAASMPSLFSQSMETTIIDEITKQVEGRIPSEQSLVESITESLSEDREFGRKIRNWVLEEIDYSDIAQTVKDDIDYSVLIEELVDSNEMFQEENFTANILNNHRMKTLVDNAVARSISSITIAEVIEAKMQEYLAVLSVEAADKAIKIIMQRVTKGDDE